MGFKRRRRRLTCSLVLCYCCGWIVRVLPSSDAFFFPIPGMPRLATIRQAITTDSGSTNAATTLLEQVSLFHTNPNITQENSNALLAQCVAHDEWDHVLEVLAVMKENGLTQVQSTYKACLLACYNQQNVASGLEILSAMKLARISVEVDDYSQLILLLCEANDWEKALQLEAEARSHQQRLPVTTLHQLFKCIREHGQWKMGLDLLNKLPEPDTKLHRLVLECCVEHNHVEPAITILDTHKMTTHDYEVVVIALCRKRQWRSALKLLDAMQDRNIRRSIRIYNPILTAASKAKETVATKVLLNRMKDDVPPDILSYNAALSACANQKYWRDALKLFDQAHRAPGVTPDIYTYTNAIRACAKGGMADRAIILLRAAKDLRLPLDTICYTAAIEACRWEKALDLLEEMEETGIEPSEVTYSVTIKACGAGGEWQKALDLLQTMRAKNMPINIFVYNAAITAISRAAKQLSKTGENNKNLFAEVSSLLDQMKQDGLEPDGFSYSSAISCCGSEGRWREALDLISIMEGGGPKTKPNKIAYTAAISSCGKAGKADKALELFRKMNRQGMSADIVAYNALFAALRVASRSDEAFQLWDDMLGDFNKSKATTKFRAPSNRVVRPDMITLTDAIGAMSSVNDTKALRGEIDKVFAEAVHIGVILRDDTLDSDFEYDLSGMSIPVAKAACRFILNRLLQSGPESVSDLVLITGVGSHHAKANGAAKTSLRDYVQETLQTDFTPGLVSYVDERAKGTIVVSSTTMKNWMKHVVTAN